MNAIPTPLWRCKTCDEQFEEPQIWPADQGAAARSVADPIEDPEIPIAEELRVCPRCHSAAIERWQ